MKLKPLTKPGLTSFTPIVRDGKPQDDDEPRKKQLAHYRACAEGVGAIDEEDPFG